ncbi:uncharacterized protein LOC121253780 isoform X6 [Juglans microcarpa x Juglans regia]|uniref:uncharacterized protein LOC121253780 isoform X5 n=1 Tax=Juglans microcarpa x Juglans regia TaxID=2249226 RepID=UPI001B7DB50C|nr:uncharacterized protein LOC121253780 isoform X5 [Juglans microcarpa x Juglans regia]XP_041009680.1 uncharacterized protein LOC121253780 isoform X6 [Juglans microcarpa x Juglans regia]
MDHQDQKHEGHGVHCHKCGWPFPNPHPSARHRRAHKKICGTIEGYKLVDSEDNPHLNISDEEHLSDEDHAAPSPRVPEKTNNEKGSRGIGVRSNRSEDDLFSDAVAEFSDGGVSAGNEDVEKVAKDDPKIIVGVADIIQPPSISADSSQVENPEVPQSTANQLGSKLHLEDHMLSSTTSSMARSISHYITEESVMLSHDRACPPDDSNIIKPETLTDASQGNVKANAREDVTECSLPCVVQEADTKGTEESNRNFTDFMVSTSRFAGESFETVPKLEETVEQSLDPLTADRVFKSEEDHHDGSSSKKNQNDPPPEVYPADHVNASFDSSQIEVDAAQIGNHASSGSMVDSGNRKEEGNYNASVLSVSGGSANHVNASIDTTQIKVDATEEIHHANSGHIIESCNRNGEENADLNVLSVTDDASIVNHPGVVVEHFKDTKEVKLQEYAILDSCTTITDKEDSAKDSASEENSSSFQSRQLSEGTELPSGHIIESCNRNADVNVLSVTDDTSIVNHPEVVVEHFKDAKEVTLQEYAIPDSCATITDKEDSAKDSASEENSSSFQSRQLSEGIEVPSSISVLGDSVEHEGGSIKVGIEVLAEEGAEVSQIKVAINEIGSPAEVVIPDIEENHMVQSHEEQETNDIHCNELMVNFPQSATKHLSDAGSNQVINLVGVDDAASHEQARNERLDIVGDDNGKGATEENCNKITSKNAESTGNLSESLVDPTMDLPEGDEAGDHEKGKTEKYDIDGTDSREGPKEDDLSIKPKLTSESTSSLHESQAVADDIRDGSLKKLPEHEFMHLDGVSHSSRVGDDTVLDASLKYELNGSEKVEVESLGVSTANESYRGGDVNSLQKTSEDHIRQESNPSDLVTESSVQSSAAVEDNHVTEFGGSASGITSESLEGDNNNVKQQIAASAIDASVDSYSQTDSLEGNWGSVSVLSTQSVTAALIDTETLPSLDSQALAEAEKALLEKPKAAPERQRSDKSDMFEAPSFMTLVEPRDRSDQKGTASEVQTGQNPPQQSASLQAGWFPSLTHVVNDSQGRKKNEEIIAKVTNWSTGKQHTPLKSLLGEASLESKLKLKKAKENPAPATQKDETFPKDNGASVTTVNSILGPESHTTQAARTETKKEWNSPARYPSEIKREKRKVKGRPYWVQLVCCSSMN